jgi:DNA-binding transcriptional LysR family regulator
MNLKKLEAFALVVEKKSFSEAAIVLKSSQPSVSLKVKSLEEDLGLELLARGVSGIQPTAAGWQVYRASKEILDRWRKLEIELGEYQDTLTGVLTIGASTIPGTYLLPKWLKKFRSLYPKVEVVIEIGDSKEMVDKLQDHRLDVAITGLQMDSAKILSTPVASDSLVLITPMNHPLMESGNQDMRELVEYDFVLREEGSGTKKVMEDYLTSHGLSLMDLKTVVKTGSTEAVISAVEAGLGISFISKLAALPAAKAKRVELIEKLDPFQRNFYFSVLKESENRPIVKEFAEIVITGTIQFE